MPIKATYKGGGNFIRTPGEYIVSIVELKVGKSKKDKPMLTVVMENASQQKIAGYYVKGLKFHMDALNDLKTACGLSPSAHQDDLIGQTCGILVEEGTSDELGRSFMQIVGYGPTSEVSNQVLPEAFREEDIQF